MATSTSIHYVLPPATAAILGGIKQGANVSISTDGTLSIPSSAFDANGAAAAVAARLPSTTTVGRLARFTDTAGTEGQTAGIYEDGSGNIRIGSTTAPVNPATVSIKNTADQIALSLTPYVGQNTVTLRWNDSSGNQIGYLKPDGTIFTPAYIYGSAFKLQSPTGFQIYDGGSSNTVYFRDSINGRMHVTLTYGASASAATTNISSKLTVDGNAGFGTTSPTANVDNAGDTYRQRTSRTPASSSAAGNVGDQCWDANYFYVCVATNTWKRVALSTW